VVQAFEGGRLTEQEAARVLRRSIRTVFRLQARLRSRGIEGLVHGNKGRVSQRRCSTVLQRRILRLVRRCYTDVNDTQLCELLGSQERIRLGRETLRRILRQAGIGPKRKRRPSKYRRRRERKAAFGMMLQIDASPHDWLQGRGPWLALVGAIDDATNFRWARFVEAETTWSYLDLLHGVALSHGLPLSLYSDRHGIFFSPREPTIEEELRGIGPLTQFGRAMDELGIPIIPAYSPQAKGRVERMWGVLQDRLVVELRLANARTLDEANAVLERFLVGHNARFRVVPAQSTAVFRSAPSSAKLDRICCLKDLRTVSNDHTISFEGLVLQIPPSKSFHSIARRKVDVLQLRDGSIEIAYRGRCVARFSPGAVARMVRAKPNIKTDLKAA
jgi:transposase